MIRNIFYMIARILGDLIAIKKGKAGKRLGRRIAGKQTGSFLKSLFK